MLLTFNVKYRELVLKEKTTTWRWDWPRWWKWALKGEGMEVEYGYEPGSFIKKREGTIGGTIMLNRSWGVLETDRILHVKWRNPRNGGLPLGRALLKKMELMQAYDLTEEHARTDGFGTLDEFQEAIMKTGKGEKILADKGVLITMGEWLDGPHDIVCHNCLKRKKSQPGRELSFCGPCMVNGENPKGGKLVP